MQAPPRLRLLLEKRDDHRRHLVGTLPAISPRRLDPQPLAEPCRQFFGVGLAPPLAPPLNDLLTPCRSGLVGNDQDGGEAVGKISARVPVLGPLDLDGGDGTYRNYHVCLTSHASRQGDLLRGCVDDQVQAALGQLPARPAVGKTPQTRIAVQTTRMTAIGG